MEVLLLQDISGIGQKDDLLIVGDGYALNYLLPQSKALIATPTVRRRYADRIRRRALEREQARKTQQQTAAALLDKKLLFSRKVSEAGKLYAAVTEKNIVEALKEQHNLDVTEDAINLAAPIKSLGDFEAIVHLGGAAAPVSITVVAEDESK